ncbi:ABC transporter ATP-binding protein [Bacillus sp. PK3_68]|uniref:ATP-binding cassette domain-containing protein n=1 Tax=Bacillus sp. PK3_68 TaxID=2027408 RepID=UPI001601C444|nr:ABC transporter ATP-binding protein [Bacillus sp. PK3_68]
MGKIIEATEAGFSVNGKDILKRITMEVETGVSVAVMGANGSGKSSLIKLLAGISEPQTGRIQRNFTSYAYVPEHFPEHLSFTVKNYLQLLAGMDRRQEGEKAAHYARLFGLEPFLDTPLKKCSKGTKQKAGFIQALMKKAEVLFLDEPFTGMDESSVQIAASLLMEWKGTIVFTLHETELAYQLATHIAILENGHLTSLSPVQRTSHLMEITYRMNENRLKAVQLVGDTYRLTVEETESDKTIGEILKNSGHIIEVKEKEER